MNNIQNISEYINSDLRIIQNIFLKMEIKKYIII